MDLISILATVILVTTIGTMVAGVGAYIAFKLRDKRKPIGKKIDDTLIKYNNRFNVNNTILLLLELYNIFIINQTKNYNFHKIIRFYLLF